MITALILIFIAAVLIVALAPIILHFLAAIAYPLIVAYIFITEMFKALFLEKKEGL